MLYLFLYLKPKESLNFTALQTLSKSIKIQNRTLNFFLRGHVNVISLHLILSNEAPLYLSDFVEFYVPGRTNLRSTKSNVLIIKRKDTKTTCKNYGWRDFRVFAPFLWNDLPVFIRQTESIVNFKKRLKAHLFVRHFR